MFEDTSLNFICKKQDQVTTPHLHNLPSKSRIFVKYNATFKLQKSN